ncbi:DUF58 domain-containing protein [Leptolyngbya sp. FACHB-261]|uniref:DUF58 domain-containing protein n=1 Tax=Leptolyngbya sp. FACHB-261 TaxID=2692806 RepID=UPI0016832EDB|nr:DUF58 domain-containing protein [Leptolyngbya sp. FACHB-261]MBD2103825.1 DUF58 domain-containing protein [Leptolyngbya sp. FACHB-261]
MSRKISSPERFTYWLEQRWVNPAFAGWLLSGFATFFFLAGTNTLAGWLYVISGVSFALLLLGAVLPARSLRSIQVSRRPIAPVSAGDVLTVELQIHNQTDQARGLLVVEDLIPFVIGPPQLEVVENLAPTSSHRWTYTTPTVPRRGVYRWQEVQLRTAAPLGLFWCRRQRNAPAVAVVYPTVLPLAQCPLVDEMGRETSQTRRSLEHRFLASTEGVTRSLRPYRRGDSTRLIHWRTSARYGDLRVRELERSTGVQEVVIALDCQCSWNPEDFEQAVIAAASLYFYGRRRNLSTRLWSSDTGLLQGDRSVLEVLAAIQPTPQPSTVSGRSTQLKPASLPSLPLAWLSSSAPSQALPLGSRVLLWGTQSQTELPGLIIQPNQPLQNQLQGLAQMV